MEEENVTMQEKTREMATWEEISPCSWLSRGRKGAMSQGKDFWSILMQRQRWTVGSRGPAERRWWQSIIQSWGALHRLERLAEFLAAITLITISREQKRANTPDILPHKFPLTPRCPGEKLRKSENTERELELRIYWIRNWPQEAVLNWKRLTLKCWD